MDGEDDALQLDRRCCSCCKRAQQTVGHEYWPSAPRAIASSAFAGFSFPPDVVVFAVRWYLRFGLSNLQTSSCYN
jgi:hypothetical protein